MEDGTSVVTEGVVQDLRGETRQPNRRQFLNQKQEKTNKIWKIREQINNHIRSNMQMGKINNFSMVCKLENMISKVRWNAHSISFPKMIMSRDRRDNTCHTVAITKELYRKKMETNL